MFKRTSVVDQLKIDSLIFSSVLEIGDSSYIQSLSRALAVQRESEIFHGYEGNFNLDPLFRMPIPREELSENITITSNQLNPVIKVHSVDILGVSAASSIHIGSSQHIVNEARVKHIRHLHPAYHRDISNNES